MPKGNPYGGYKPHKLRNPKVVTLYHEKGKIRIVHCIKFDVLRNEKLQITDYVATAREPNDWFTASIFPAKHWMTKEEWEKRKEAAKRSLPKAPAPEVNVASATIPVPEPPAPVPAPPSSPEAPKPTFISLEEEEDELSEADMKALEAPPAPQKVLTINDELPNEYNAKLHLKEKFGLGRPEDLVTFEAHVATNVIAQEAQRKIEQMKHRAEMNRKLMSEHAGFMPDGS